MSTLLIIDDEESIRYSFQRAFEGAQVKVVGARTGAEGLERIRELRPDVVVLDLHLPDRSGMDVFREIHAADPKRPVIFLTAHGSTETAIEAMKNGAFDYLVKPVVLERLSQLIERAFEAARLMHVPAVLPTGEFEDRIVGHSPVMQEMCKAIGRIAPQNVNVLIQGESGTGKELVARALYYHSRRMAKPFLAINCAAIPESLLESELFGHEQGSFTGASRRRIGKFEQCDGGTLFLDEIGDMAPSIQAKMLRVMQEQQFERLGSNETLQTSVRVLAATNQDLEALVEKGSFRKDLYYRLKVITIRVPPLRDRLDDVSELAHYFLFRFDRELNLDVRTLARETLDVLRDYPWPGNVRELQSSIKQAMLSASGNVLAPEFLPDEILHHHHSGRSAVAPQGPAADLNGLIESLLQQGEKDLYRKVLEAMERVLLAQALRHTKGHQANASELLGLNRATLRHKLRSLGLGVDKIVIEENAPKAEGAS
jgi:two-component system nitrogen regulation response regulator GlnG